MKFLSILYSAFFGAALSLALSACVPGAKPGTFPGGGIASPLNGSGNPLAVGGDNAATGDPSKGEKENNNDDDSGSEENTAAFVPSPPPENGGGGGDVRPGSSYPDPEANPGGNTFSISALYFDPFLKEKDVCLVSSGEAGKRVKVKLAGVFILAPRHGSRDERIRIIDKKDHEYLDVKETYQPSVGNGHVSFTLTVTLPLQLKAYLLPQNLEADRSHIERPCGQGEACSIDDDYLLDIIYPHNLGELAHQAPRCSNDQEDDSSND